MDTYAKPHSAQTVPSTFLFNKSVYFMLPLLDTGIGRHNLLNTYLGMYDRDGVLQGIDGYKLYLLSEQHHKQLTHNVNFVRYGKVGGENNRYLYEYTVPERFHNEYRLFIDGKYSLFSEEAKQLICKEAPGNIRKSFVHKVLYKDPERKLLIEEAIGQKLPKDAEVCSIINLNDEIYDRK